MYFIKDDINLKSLEKYGFKIGRDIADNERCICNDSERDDYWLISMDPDEPNEVFYADEEYNQPIWSIHIQSNRRVWVDCVPSYTYHIDNMDMEQMFYVLKCMIEDGIITDNYEKQKRILRGRNMTTIRQVVDDRAFEKNYNIEWFLGNGKIATTSAVMTSIENGYIFFRYPSGGIFILKDDAIRSLECLE